MHVKTLAGLLVLASAAACGPGRTPVASGPAPAVAPAPPPARAENPAVAAAAAATSDGGIHIGADLLGGAAYDMPIAANLSVRNELEFLVRERHAVVGSWLRNAERYHEFVRDVFASHGVPRDLSHLGMIESGYRPTVRSHAGAVGVWQFMPATGRQMGLRIDSLVDERMDPVRATHAAARHLRYLHRRFGGDWSLAAAAYNAGEGRITRGMSRFGARDFWDLANRGDLAQETRRYVPRLYATTIIAKDPVRFGYPAPGFVRRFAYDSVRVDMATPLGVLADAGDLPLNELTEFNPHLFRGVAPRDYWVWVPQGQGRPLQQAYTDSEFRRRGGYATYRVREGDSLSRLAELSGLTTDQIRSMNLSANTDALAAGTTLRVYADAARVLNARPEPRVASRAEPARSRPRVLGDPPAAEAERVASAAPAAASAASAEPAPGAEPRESAAASAPARPRRPAAASSPSASPSSASSSAASPSSERRGAASSSSASSERRSGAASSSSSERRSGQAASTGSGSSRRAGASPSSTEAARTHTVGGGETLWAISRRYGVPVDAVRAANDMESETIRVGQTLRIPRAAPAADASTGAARPSTATAPAPPREHTVAEGETLWGIARRFETTVDGLRRANELEEDEQIRPGQTLSIPRD